MICTPVPSPALDEIAAAAVAAQSEYRAAFDRYLEQRPSSGGLSRETEEKFARDRFESTDAGTELAAAYIATERAHRAAREVGERITLAGRTWRMCDLSEAGRAAVYRAAAAHGHDVTRWPAGVADELERFLNTNHRPPTFGEIAESRRVALVNLRADIDRTLEGHGLDPSRWPVAVLDEIALSQLRIDAFDQLVQRARSLDVEWNHRPSSPVTATESRD